MKTTVKEMTMTKKNYICPKCDSEFCSSFEMIFCQGTTDLHSQSVSFANIDGHGAIASTFGAGTQQSKLATICAPPVMKKINAGFLTKVGIFCLGVIGLLIISALLIDLFSTNEPIAITKTIFHVVILFFIILGIVGLSVQIRNSRDAENYNNGPFQQELAKWKKKWMCQKCGNSWSVGE